MIDLASSAPISSVSSADWVLLFVLTLSLLVGLWRGLVYEVLSVLGWIAAFFIAQWLAPNVAAILPLSSVSASVRFALAFVVTFVAAVFVAGLLAALLKKLVSAIGLRPVDRLLGGFFGLVRGLVFLLAATLAIEMTPLKSSGFWQASKGAPVLSATLKGLKPALPAHVARFLN